MSPILTLILVLLAIIILVAVIAFLLRKAGFRVDKITAKLPVVEMEASREQPKTQSSPTAAGPKIRQRAREGGVIEKSGITAPADSTADIDQHSQGEKSRIDDSPIKLT